MKTLKTTALALGLFSLLAGTTIVRAQDYDDGYQDSYRNDNDVSLQTFYDELSPYGTWIQDREYGYVWRPDVDQRTFRPYFTEGRWAMTEYGNTWVSNYDWGWAPFHYGRWVYNNYRQWVWLPDTKWGPAWVDWRSGGGYYGWAPTGPSININISFGRRYYVPNYCWNFIPQRNIYNDYYPRYNYGRNNIYFRNTTIINNTYVYNRNTYYSGPSRYDVRRATNRDVTVYRVGRSSRPGASIINNDNVEIYRPRPSRGESNRTAAPNNYQRGSLATTSSETSGRPERGGSSNNVNTDIRNSNRGNETRPDQNGNRSGTVSSRPQRGDISTSQQKDRGVMERNPAEQRGVNTSENQSSGRPSRNADVSDQRPANDAARQQRQEGTIRDLPRERGVMERNPAKQSGISSPSNQNGNRPGRTSDATNQRINSDAVREQRASDDQTRAAAAQQQQQAVRTQREAEVQQQRNAQAAQQNAQRAQQEKAAQSQRQEQVQQQRAQRAQREQATQTQKQEQARQQQPAPQRPQRVERAEAPRPSQSSPPRESTRNESRPSRGD